MLSYDSSLILGSVVQRTLVPRNMCGPVSIVTVPLKEIAGTNEPEAVCLEDLVSCLFGVARRELLNDHQLGSVFDLLRDPTLRETIFRDCGSPLAFEASSKSWIFSRMLEDIEQTEHDPRSIFGYLALNCQLARWAGIRISAQRLLPTRPPLNSESAALLRDQKWDFDATALVLSMLYVTLRDKGNSENTLKELCRWEIPFGNSPKATSIRLFDVLRTPHATVLAPICDQFTLFGTHKLPGTGASLVLTGGVNLTQVVYNALFVGSAARTRTKVAFA